MNKYMQLAYDAAVSSVNGGVGGPFGAVVVRGGEVIAVSGNRVLAEKDPTAHAEISAIRDACARLGTYSLRGCEIYATGEPCPMCLSAIAWAGIEKCYFANPVSAAAALGFDDADIYAHIRGEKTLISCERLDDCAACVELYRLYAEKKGTMY